MLQTSNRRSLLINVFTKIKEINKSLVISGPRNIIIGFTSAKDKALTLIAKSLLNVFSLINFKVCF